MVLKMDSKKQKGMLNLGGLGHTAVIHTENEELQLQYGIRMKACRVLVNSPSAEGGIGKYLQQHDSIIDSWLWFTRS